MIIRVASVHLRRILPWLWNCLNLDSIPKYQLKFQASLSITCTHHHYNNTPFWPSDEVSYFFRKIYSCAPACWCLFRRRFFSRCGGRSLSPVELLSRWRRCVLESENSLEPVFAHKFPTLPPPQINRTVPSTQAHTKIPDDARRCPIFGTWRLGSEARRGQLFRTGGFQVLAPTEECSGNQASLPPRLKRTSKEPSPSLS